MAGKRGSGIKLSPGGGLEGGAAKGAAAITRRRLLQLAAYSVPAMSVLNVAGAARAQGFSPPCQQLTGWGLLRDLYDNPFWQAPWVQCCVVEAPCHSAPWYPLPLNPGLPRDTTFSARWAGNLIVRVPGVYQLRVRGTDFAAGALMVVNPPSFHVFGAQGIQVDLPCGQHLLDIVFSHFTQNQTDAEVCLEWIPPGGVNWVPVPESDLYYMW